jgi:hypothetical protein
MGRNLSNLSLRDQPRLVSLGVNTTFMQASMSNGLGHRLAHLIDLEFVGDEPVRRTKGRLLKDMDGRDKPGHDKKLSGLRDAAIRTR